MSGTAEPAGSSGKATAGELDERRSISAEVLETWEFPPGRYRPATLLRPGYLVGQAPLGAVILTEQVFELDPAPPD